MYDPLGLVGPIAHCGKILFQEAARFKLSWDEQVPAALAQKWMGWKTSLGGIEALKFDRCLVSEKFVNGSVELHHFCDASQVGYGACAYLRVVNHWGQIPVRLIMSKGRLAPLKQMTMPRLELSAAVVAVKLDSLIRRDLDISVTRSLFWTDSQIRNEDRRYKVFVANRVSAIRQCSTTEQWHYIRGYDNPADVLSRRCTVGNLPEAWVTGPAFLYQYKSQWTNEESKYAYVRG